MDTAIALRRVTKSNADIIREAWGAAAAARIRAAERRLMPSLSEPIHPRACECPECRRTYGAHK